jgi:FdhE protein
MTTAVYDARIRRANELLSRYPFAKEVLNFYLRLANFQKDMLAKIAVANGAAEFSTQTGALRERIDVAILLPEMRTLLSIIETHAPPPLAEFSGALKQEPASAWLTLVSRYCTEGGKETQGEDDPREELIARIITQPFAEFLSGRTAAEPLPTAPLVCPLCDGLPVAGLLRPEGDGGKRFLLCSFCGHEWEFRRIFCAACGEDREGQLPVFLAEQFPQVRVECCDTCRHYVRSVDLTKDGHAVPVVDDLAAIPLTLWADQHGYARLEPNLLAT